MPESWKHQPRKEYLPRNHSALSNAYWQFLGMWTAGYMTALCGLFLEPSQYLMLFWKDCSALSPTRRLRLSLQRF